MDNWPHFSIGSFMHSSQDSVFWNFFYTYFTLLHCYSLKRKTNFILKIFLSHVFRAVEVSPINSASHLKAFAHNPLAYFLHEFWNLIITSHMGNISNFSFFNPFFYYFHGYTLTNTILFHLLIICR